MIRISTRDVGLTQVATVWVGEHRAIEFYTHTRHKDTSLEAAEEFLANALGDLLRKALEGTFSVGEWKGKPGGDHYDDYGE